MDNFSVENMTAKLTRIAGSWDRRATVKQAPVFHEKLLDESKPDYPSTLIPFWEHPDFQAHDADLKFKLLSHAWVNYNNNTITAEENVANPAFYLMMTDKFPGTHYESMKKNMIQALIDEHYHTYMHMSANFATKRIRALNKLVLPHSVSYRHFLKAQEDATESWQKDLLTVVWAIVSEISINAYLSLLEDAKDIQQVHCDIAKAHNLDEYGHAKICFEVAKSIYANMNKKQKRYFVDFLPLALKAFVANDYSVWRATLEQLNFKKVDTIIGDCELTVSKKNLIRDYSGLKHIVFDLEIENEIDFDFGI
ncbi:diiron oxygenase [Vibrio sp. Of14-4]|uniref:diiron oxygenase n=1 Tax=Vibrio sp. Of14-4 TaxID=2724878 RepID=UPI001EF2B7AA|nr:diiron oxygenase [Vibrio sp. Of14-4]MCG7490557.1 diiron oxygenase [Vibrio sp. Of14-4]